MPSKKPEHPDKPYSFLHPGQPMMKTIFEWLMVLVGFAILISSIFGIIELRHGV